MGGTPKRMEQFAYYIMEEIGHRLPTGTTLQDISRYSYRYCMYKVGPVLAISVSLLVLQTQMSLTVTTETKGSKSNHTDVEQVGILFSLQVACSRYDKPS
jgi:hypothetical protein